MSYTTYDDTPGLGAAVPSLETLDFVQGDKSALAGDGVKVVLFIAKFDKGGGPVITQFSKLKDQQPGAQFIAVFTDPEKAQIARFFEKKEFNLTFPAAFDPNKTVQNEFKTLLKVGALPIPYAFIVKGGKIVWQQVFSQNHQLHNSNFARQLQSVVAGQELEKAGPTPAVEESSSDDEGEKAPEGDGDLSLF